MRGQRVVLQTGAGDLRLEEGQPVDVKLALAALDDDRAGAAAERRQEVDATARQDAGAEAEAVRAVVVAADGDDRDGEVAGDPLEEIAEEGYGLDRRHGAVEEVPGDDQGVDPLVAAHGEDLG